MKNYQIWHNPVEWSYTLICCEDATEEIVMTFLTEDADIIHEFEAETHEQAITKRNKLLGW